MIIGKKIVIPPVDLVYRRISVFVVGVIAPNGALSSASFSEINCKPNEILRFCSFDNTQRPKPFSKHLFCSSVYLRTR